MEQREDGLVVTSLAEALEFGEEHNWTVCFRPAFIPSGSGGFPCLSTNQEQFKEILEKALAISPTTEVLLQPN